MENYSPQEKKDKVTYLTDYASAQAEKDETIRKRKMIKTRSLIYLGLALIILGPLAYNSYQSQQKLTAINEEIEEVNKEVADLDEYNQELTDYLSLLEDDEYIEKIARNEYFLSKDGEIVFNLQDSEKISEDPIQRKQEEEKKEATAEGSANAEKAGPNS